MEEDPQIGIWGVFLCPGRITRKRALAVSGEDFSGDRVGLGIIGEDGGPIKSIEDGIINAVEPYPRELSSRVQRCFEVRSCSIRGVPNAVQQA